MEKPPCRLYLGESVASVTEYLSKLDLSQFSDPFRIEDIHEYMESVAPNNRAAKASVDIALRTTLTGKIMGQPWYKIWGLNPDKCPEHLVHYQLRRRPVEMKKKIEETSPYKVVKVKMGLDHDKGDCGGSAPAYRRAHMRRCQPRVEQRGKRHSKCATGSPNATACSWSSLWTKRLIDDTAWLRERSPLPIIADEFLQRLPDVRRAAQAYDGINIKLMKSTGMHEAYQMATLARPRHMKVMLGCMTETSCAVSAAAQLAPMVDWADLDGNLLIANDIFDGAKIVDGKVTLNDRPGIGAIPLA